MTDHRKQQIAALISKLELINFNPKIKILIKQTKNNLNNKVYTDYMAFYYLRQGLQNLLENSQKFIHYK